MRNFLHKSHETYKDFSAIVATEIEELDCFYRELLHEPTGATIIHIENDDPENLFCLSFQTLPSDDKGTPHILEHVTLCGSKKYPVKDPFFSMSRRSLNTFMNAFTGADFTCYPAATQVEKDFYNLLDVYLDAVFHPLINPHSFLQEGCRLEFEEPEDPTSPLEYKGIVYNEMKGSMAPESRLWHESIKAIFPDLPYAYNSGGEPKKIPDLTYEELVEFHKKNYHPSQCLFFFYGSLPLKKHLDFITDKVLGQLQEKTSPSNMPLQKRFHEPCKTTLPYPADPEQKNKAKALVSCSWLTCTIKEPSEVLALSLLDAVLMESDASPLKKELLASGLATQIDAMIDTEVSEIPYTLTFKGCNPEDVDKLEECLFAALRKLSKAPFPDALIDAALHQMEFSRTEITGDHGPFGLSLFFRTALTKQHGGDPLHSLMIHSLFEDLLEKVKDPKYLPALIEKYFIQNPHFARVTLLPDFSLEEKEIQEEKDKLQKMANALSEKEKLSLVKQSKDLEAMQKKFEEQDLNCLPKVTLDDVPLLPKEFPLKESLPFPEIKVFHHSCFTNAILYADYLFDLPAVLEEEIPYLRLLLAILPSLGAGGRNYTENLEYMMSYTGGVSTSCSLFVQATDSKKKNPALHIRGKALSRHVSKLFSLMRDTIETPDFTDHKRLKELIEQIWTALQTKVSKNALRYGIQLSLSGYDEATYFGYHSSGIPYYHFIESLVSDLNGSIPKLAMDLSKLHKKLFSFHEPHLVLTCDDKLFHSANQKIEIFTGLTKTPFIPWDRPYPLTPVDSQGRIITSPVAYNVKAYDIAPFIHPYAPALYVASQLFEHTTLHNKIREIGGAYGTGATYNSLTGSFYFYSYRDPHIQSTFDVFDEAIDKVAKGDFGFRDLEEAKLATIQQMDMPVSPGSHGILGYNLYRDGKTKEMRAEFRKTLLNLTALDIELAVKSEFITAKRHGVEVTLAGKPQLERENRAVKVLPF